MTRVVRVAAALVLIAPTACDDCREPGLGAGERCDPYLDDCGTGLDCVSLRCLERCKVPGDCPSGRRCARDYCLQVCDTQPDCAFGTCSEVEPESPGKVCSLEGLIECEADHQCTGFEVGVCESGTCARGCWDASDCEIAQGCDFERGFPGLCVGP